LREALGHAGRGSGATAEIIKMLGHILLLQGRPGEAEKVIRAGIHIMRASGLSDDCRFIGDAKMKLGQVLVARGDFKAAAKKFEEAKESMQGNRYYYEKNISRNPDAIISQIKTGRANETITRISEAYRIYSENLGKDNYRTAEILAIRGMANAEINNTGQALNDFSNALSILFKIKAESDIDYPKKQRLWIFTEAYLDLLRNIHQRNKEKEFGINVSEISFMVIEGMKSGSVQMALGASVSRAVAGDPAIADIVRREQDAQKQIKALQETLSNALASAHQNPSTLDALKTNIDRLKGDRVSLLDEINQRFPEYSDYAEPKSITIMEVQKYLNKDESLITIYPTSEFTYIWAIPKEGKISFAIIDIGEKSLHETVTKLRLALNPGPKYYGDIIDFNLVMAYELYGKILEPVENGWKDSKDLLVAVSGSLGMIPFGILPTAPSVLSTGSDTLFANYQETPWLIRRASITRVPSAKTFVALRSVSIKGADRRAFVGFGDPIFNPTQLAEIEKEPPEKMSLFDSPSGELYVRGIRITEVGSLDENSISSCHIGMLNRLPDTKEEILSIAHTIGADPVADVFLGKQANEQQVKSMDLSDRRVIAFATHALVPGDIDGLHQVAIALSAPTVTGGDDDGLLTMEEVFQLRLNADWVVLSACNTGAAEGAGAEALSGLGQAFFYAGTRAILVSMWPVETTSAKKLTTRLFRFQKEEKTISRAKALQKSILSLIDDPGIKDISSEKIIASYAHPLFWAPFIIVGDGGK